MKEEFPNQPRAPRRSGRIGCGMVAFIAFGVGLGLFAAVGEGKRFAWPHFDPAPSAPPPAPSKALSDREAGLEARLATVEQRMIRIDMAAATAADNAGRAEALLVAFAARRSIDRGAQLGYLETPLKQHFADKQPAAVAAILAAAHTPVTQDRLSARLEALSTKLLNRTSGDTLWGRLRSDLSGMLVLHSDSGAVGPDPRLRLDHARICLAEGRVDDAIADVRLLPGAAAADKWIAEAHRYAEVQHALDVVETEALLAPAPPKPTPSPSASPEAKKP